MKKINYIIGNLLILSIFSICLPSKAIALSKDSSCKLNKASNIYKAVNEKMNTSLKYNCDPKFLIPGNPDIDPKMLIPANPDIDSKIFIVATPSIDVNSPIERSKASQPSRASTSKGD